MTLTLEQMRNDIAKVLEVEPAEIKNDDHLPDLGLDSLRLMRLVMQWEQEAGLNADFSVFAEYATLGEWWHEVAAIQDSA